MKVKVSADTADFKKGMQQSKSALKDLDKTGKGALDSLGQAFGVNTGKIGQLVNSVKGLGVKLSESGNAGTAAFGKLLSSIGPVGGALAGLGVAAVTAAFKELNRAADDFKNIMAGEQWVASCQTWKDTYNGVMSDMQSSTAKTFNNIKESMSRLWTETKRVVGGTLSEWIFGDSKGLKESYNTVQKANKEAKTAADNAADARLAMEKDKATLIERSVRVAELEADIADLRQKATDPLYTAQQRLGFINEAAAKIKEKYALQLPLLDSIAKKTSYIHSLSPSSTADAIADADAKKKAEAARRGEADELRTLSRQGNTLKTQAEAEAAATQKILDTRKEMAEMGLKSIDTSSLISNKVVSDSTVDKSGGIVVPVKAEVDEESVSLSIEQLRDMVTDAAVAMSEAIGGLIGNLINGEDAWGNFGNAALSTLADMAKKVGEILLAQGIAILMASEALKSLKAGPAIAAGLALIAVASATKAALSNVANGGGAASSYSSSSASSGYSGSSGMYQQSEVEIKVTGTLKGEGSALVAVLNNEENRRYHTT